MYGVAERQPRSSPQGYRRRRLQAAREVSGRARRVPFISQLSLQDGEALQVARIDLLDKDRIQTEALAASLDGILLRVPDAKDFFLFDECILPSLSFLQ